MDPNCKVRAQRKGEVMELIKVLANGGKDEEAGVGRENKKGSAAGRGGLKARKLLAGW